MPRYAVLAEALNIATDTMRLPPFASELASVHQDDGSINLSLQDRAVGAMLELVGDEDDCSLVRRHRRHTIGGLDVEMAFVRRREFNGVAANCSVSVSGQMCFSWAQQLAYRFLVHRADDDVDTRLVEYGVVTGEVTRVMDYPFLVADLLPAESDIEDVAFAFQAGETGLPAAEDLGDRGVDFETSSPRHGDSDGED